MKFFKGYNSGGVNKLKGAGKSSLLSAIVYSATGLVVLLLLWEFVVFLLLKRDGYGQFDGLLPVPAFKSLFGLIMEPVFWMSVAASLKRVVIGIMIAFVFGLPFGLFMGFYRRLMQTTYTPVQFLRMISPLAWMPIALLIFETFEGAIYFLISMATVWPIIINTVMGVSSVNPEWISMGLNQGASDRQLLIKIVLPATVPHILTSLRLALGVAWIVLVPAELLGVSSGLGYLINDARDTLEYDRLMALVIAIGFLGVLLDGALQIAESILNKDWANTN